MTQRKLADMRFSYSDVRPWRVMTAGRTAVYGECGVVVMAVAGEGAA